MPNKPAKTSAIAVGDERQTCLVIGGGLAGLAAALRAKGKRWQVHVFEAQAELGGRVKSHYFHDPRGYCHLVCELGGEWIGNDHKRMWKLVDEFKLDTINHQYSLSFWDVNRQVQVVYRPNESPFSAELQQAFKDFGDEFRAMSKSPAKLKKLDKLDWWTKLKQMGYREEDLARRDLMDGTDFGESIRHTSAYAGATEYVSTRSSKADDTDEMDFKIVGGNSLLVQAMEKKIGAYSIHKGSAVEIVVQRRNSGKVEVRLAKRRGLRGRRMYLRRSGAVLEQDHLEAPEAGGSIGSGRATSICANHQDCGAIPKAVLG
jgi:monoamine oxidase